MATLYTRANPSQAMILRIVEGALKNASDSHGKEFDPYFARSVAKRAAGTLSAEMPAVLAAKPSEKLGVATQLVMSARAARQAHLARPGEAPRWSGARGRAVLVTEAARLRLLEKWIARQMRAIKSEGREEYASAFIAVLRKISEIRPTQRLVMQGDG